jgi:hypothetical protein
MIQKEVMKEVVKALAEECNIPAEALQVLIDAIQGDCSIAEFICGFAASVKQVSRIAKSTGEPDKRTRIGKLWVKLKEMQSAVGDCEQIFGR